jgi:phosphoribosylformylglycinamidine synthase subunit PurQ / glutaminase
MVKALIVTGFGINCEIEMGAAYKNAGAETTIIHFNELIDGSYSIHDYDIFNFPGGFSFGDDIASGKVMANKIKFKEMKSGKTFIEEIDAFLKNGNYIMGVCNGFQMLVKLGLLPNLKHDFEPETTLEKNNSNKYEDRWVSCRVNPHVNTPFLKDIDILPVPVRHGEGKLIIKNEQIVNEILEKNLIALSYADENGNITDEYPKNPNGSQLNTAGLTDPSGQVFGLMPHPEAFLSFYNHPDWPKLKRDGKELERHQTGQAIFDNIVKHVKSTK